MQQEHSISNVLHYTGKLKAEKRHEGDYFNPEKEDCGEIHCTKILQTNMENEGENLYYICDCVSSELERVAHLLTAKWDKTEDGKFVNEVGDKWEVTQCDILYVSILKVKEEYRGMGLGLYLLDAADRQINSHMSLTLLIPFPLVYEESGVDRSNLKADMKRLAAYYKRLGFGSLGWPESAGSLFVARWNGYTSPRIETVCPLASQFY
jgi:GNAT superfamily N-acetyltransferase